MSSPVKTVRAQQQALAKRAGFADLLGYAFLVDNVVIMKDGGMMAVYRFYGEDVQATVESLRTVIADRWSEAVATMLTGNYMVELDLVGSSGFSVALPIL